MKPPSPAGVIAVGVRAGVGKSVAVRWPAAGVAALIAGLGAHRGGGAHAGAQDLAFGLVTEQHDRGPVGRVVEIDRPVGFGSHTSTP